MNFKFYAIVLLTVGTFSLFACKDKDGPGDSPCSSLAWSTELSDEVNAYITAASAYFSDPAPANCSAYKSAYQAYLNALRPYGDCATLTGSQRNAWQQAVDDAQQEVDNIDC